MFYNALGVSVGALQKLRDYDLTNPQVQKIIAERYGSNIPYNEIVISPEAIASESLELTNVYQN
jgi:phosphosulfolactate phosphohydrolase-like enzyme